MLSNKSAGMDGFPRNERPDSSQARERACLDDAVGASSIPNYVQEHCRRTRGRTRTAKEEDEAIDGIFRLTIS